MNRNTEVHFSNLPEVNIGRSKFDRSFTHKTTLNTADLVPIMVDSTIMPGDTIKLRLSSLVRQITPLTPVMDNLYMDTYAFFCPHRLIWQNFKYFLGENASPWTQTNNYTIPKLRLFTSDSSDTSHKVEKGSLLNYMGIPLNLGVGSSGSLSTAISINHLPIRAYCKVWNDWFKSESTQNDLYFNVGDQTANFASKTFALAQTDPYTSNVQKGAICAKVNKYFDYFTSALPTPQRGDSPLVPLVGMAPIITSETPNSTIPESDKLHQDYLNKPISFEIPSNLATTISMQVKPDNATPPGWYEIPEQKAFGLQVDMEGAVGATVAAIRSSFAIQKFYEKQARFGTRMNEVILGHFGVTNPDFRLQRSEYLGGHRIPLSINQVIQSVPSSTEPLGQTGAFSVTSDVDNDMCTYSATEWGTLLVLVAIRTDHTYQQGINKQWLMTKITDMYWPEFANLSEEPVKEIELYAQDGSAAAMKANDDVFGYQEAWASYRYTPDYISGELSSLYSQSLDIWHYGDYYTSAPTLNAEWMRETPDNVKRTLAYQNGDQFKADFYIDATYTRPMPLYSIPGLVDHH